MRLALAARRRRPRRPRASRSAPGRGRRRPARRVRRWCGRSSLASATSTRSRRVPGTPLTSATSSASPSVCTRTLVSISETSSTAESTWSVVGPVVQQLAQLARGRPRCAPARPGRPSARAARRRGRGRGRGAAASRRSSRSGDVVLAAVGQRAGGVVRGGAVHGLDQRVGQLLQVARAVACLQDRRAAAAQPVSRSWPPVSIRPSVHSSIVSPGLQDEPGGGVVGVRVDAERQPARGGRGSAPCRRPCGSPGPDGPARATSSMPVAGSTSTYRQVAKRASDAALPRPCAAVVPRTARTGSGRRGRAPRPGGGPRRRRRAARSAAGP